MRSPTPPHVRPSSVRRRHYAALLPPPDCKYRQGAEERGRRRRQRRRGSTRRPLCWRQPSRWECKDQGTVCLAVAGEKEREGGWLGEGSARNAAAAPHAEVYIHTYGKYAYEVVIPSSCLLAGRDVVSVPSLCSLRREDVIYFLIEFDFSGIDASPPRPDSRSSLNAPSLLLPCRERVEPSGVRSPSVL